MNPNWPIIGINVGGRLVRVAIAGASGLIGHALLGHWAKLGVEAVQLVRGRRAGQGEVHWDPSQGKLDAGALSGIDAAVCLSGAGIADARWTQSRKDELRRSRIETVGLLAKALTHCTPKPKCLICASATGYYGMDRGDDVITEASLPGTDFVANLCQDWEDAAAAARDAGIRVVHVRFGIVLTPKGGVLAKMRPAFRLGLGGPIGLGRQFVSWISLDDAVGVLDHALRTDAVEGAINAVSPNPVTNRDFAFAIGRAMHRPAFLPVPPLSLKLALGELSGLILGSLRVYPRVLEKCEYRFKDPEIGPALERMLTVSSR